MTLDDIKSLIAFGKELGLQSLRAEGVEIIYGVEASEAPAQDKSPAPDLPGGIPAELAHFSAAGRAAMGKR